MTQTTKELPNIRLLVLDVDGTLTDGSICMGPAGEMCKLFSVKDGLGIQMLAAAGIQVAVITGRTSEIVARRMAELPVARVVQGCADKPAALRALCEELGISPAEAAFFGDDLNDLAAMEACGLAACPADAARDVLERAQYVAPASGGKGAVRAFAEDYLRQKGLWAETARKRFGAVVNNG